MPLPWRSKLLSLLPRVGLESRPLGPGAALVYRQGRGLSVEELDDRTWVVQRRRGRRRKVRRIGPPELRTHLVVDERAARKALPNQQMKLAHYLSAEHIAWILRELRINCVLDVGGNRGQFGRRLRTAGYAGRIVSFEPLPHLAERLHDHADKDPDWHVVHCALGDEETDAEMNVVAAGGATSSLLPASDFGKLWSPRIEGVGQQVVPVRRLDSLLDETVAGIDDPRIFLKMDTQGYDLRVFAGAGDRIKDVLGLQSELSNVRLYDGMPRLPEAISTYEAAGFETTGIFPVTRDNDRLRIIEFDIIMIRVDALGER
ncbi:MAG TPA: FkbM family methyltransferase [Nocardioidaceae bacterium]|nr:FkbM family methyltransferase [Nocardioidaceae bacterium]